jgi:hypothetical protein
MSSKKQKVEEAVPDFGRVLVPSLRDYCDHLLKQKPEGDRPLVVGELRIDWLPAHHGNSVRPMVKTDDAIYLFLRPAAEYPTSELGFFRCSITSAVDPTRTEQWVEVVYASADNNLELLQRLTQQYYQWLNEVTGSDEYTRNVSIDLILRLG